jgi:hypothetical protein
MTAFVEAHFADAALAFFDEAAMPAGETFQRSSFEMFS